MKVVKIVGCLGMVFFITPLLGRNILLEFKGAYFLPTCGSFKQIYKGNALYGPELTLQVLAEKNWHIFTSFDYLKTRGYSIGSRTPTTVQLFPCAVGVKYVLPTMCKNVDFYAGLGLEGMNVRTKNCSPYVISKLSKWGFGGIAKIGGYYYLPHHFLLDIFVDYSFMSAGKTKYCPVPGVQLRSASIGSAIFGVALGYKF